MDRDYYEYRDGYRGDGGYRDGYRGDGYRGERYRGDGDGYRGEPLRARRRYTHVVQGKRKAGDVGRRVEGRRPVMAGDAIALAVRQNELINPQTKGQVATDLKELGQEYVTKAQDVYREAICSGGEKKGFFSGEKGKTRIVLIAILLGGLLLLVVLGFVGYNVYRNLTKSNNISFNQPTTNSAAPLNRQASINPVAPPPTDEEIRRQMSANNGVLPSAN